MIKEFLSAKHWRHSYGDKGNGIRKAPPMETRLAAAQRLKNGSVGGPALDLFERVQIVRAQRAVEIFGNSWQASVGYGAVPQNLAKHCALKCNARHQQ